MAENSLSVLCTIRDRKLKVFNPLQWRRGLERFGDGQELMLTLEEIGRKRTSAQNRFFHGPVIDAFVVLGYSRQGAKDMLCLWYIPDEIILPDGSVVRVPGHTSALKVERFTAFIDECIQLAAEQGVVVRDADTWAAMKGASNGTAGHTHDGDGGAAL